MGTVVIIMGTVVISAVLIQNLIIFGVYFLP